MREPSNVPRRDSSRSCSRSPPGIHRCYLALTEDQAEHVLDTGMVLRRWFGDGWYVPVKNSLHAAVKSFADAKQQDPAKVLSFGLPFSVYHEWVHGGIMRPCGWVEGYRINQNIDLNAVDTGYRLRTFQ